jgi:hypothetical protein
MVGDIGQDRREKTDSKVFAEAALQFSDGLQVEQLGLLARLVLTVHGFTHVGVKLIQSVGLGEDRSTEGPSDESSFGSLFDKEDQFSLWFRADFGHHR